MKQIISISILGLISLSGCAQMMPDIAQMVHDIEDSVISVEIDRDAIKQDTDVHIVVDVINKDLPKKQP